MEDNPDNRLLVKRILMAEDYSLLEAIDGKDALLALGRESGAAAAWKPAAGAVSDRYTLERMIVVFSHAGDDRAAAQARAALARLDAR